MILAPTPFEHGLALAWSDGALSRQGAMMLEELQQKLKLSDELRAIQEEAWLTDISRNDRRSFGDGDQILREWLDTLSDYDSMATAVKSMGRSALDVGLSKNAWQEAYSFANGLGLGDDLAKGVWLEEEVESIKEWPPALDPLAIILGLAVSMNEFFVKQDVKFIDGAPAISITHDNAKPSSLSWMQELSPLNGHPCAWGWNTENVETDSNIPEGDLVYNTSILSSWIKKLISMRNNRGETSLSGLPENFIVMPSSTELTVSGNKIILSVIVDLGKNGLVKPFASISIDETVSIDDAPSSLPESWLPIHESLSQLLLHALDTLPKQILVAAELGNCEISNMKINENWITNQIAS